MCERIKVVYRISLEHLVEQLKENLGIHLLLIQDEGLSIDEVRELTLDVLKYSMEKVEAKYIKEEHKQLVHSTMFMFAYFSILKAEMQMLKEMADKAGVSVDFFRDELNREANDNVQDILSKHNKLN